MSTNHKKILGARLRAARFTNKMSQDFVSESLGVTRQSVSAWETGVSCPSAVQLAQLATLYCVCAHEILFGESFAPALMGRVLAGCESVGLLNNPKDEQKWMLSKSMSK